MAQRNYIWQFVLQPNSLSKDVMDDYIAKFRQVNGSKTFDDVIDGVVSERIVYQRETVFELAIKIFNKILDFLCDGYIVQTPLATFIPTVSGVFDSKGEPYGDSVMEKSISMIPTNDTRNEVMKVRVIFIDREDEGGAAINRIKDLTTGKTDGSVTRGGLVEVAGNKIKCVNSDGSGIGRFVLVNDSEEETEISVLPYNDPSRIAFIFPNDLAEGNYTLRIETYFTKGSSLLKSKRTLISPFTLKTL